ncbi:MAG: lipoate-protein ligase B, partial [Chloroflexota bacterium]
AAGSGPEALVLLEHEPVYTFGRGGNLAHLLASPEVLGSLGAEVVLSDRGGDATYHGPGQIVGYLILSLRQRDIDAHRFVRGVEEIVLRALAGWGIVSERIAGLPGIWVGLRKIAAIGIRVSRGVSYHGFALNVNTDLSYFKHIVPCGIQGRGVTSMARELGQAVPLGAVRQALAAACAAVFEVPIRQPAPAELARLQELGLVPHWLLTSAGTDGYSVEAASVPGEHRVPQG